MIIEKYAAFFHDGGLIDIHHKNTTIVLSIESAEITDEDLHDKIPLSELNTFRGKLHLEEVKSIGVKGTKISRPLEMPFDSGDIFHLDIGQGMVCLDIKWCNYPPKKDVNEFSSIRIEADKIWWENIPDLFDPFWNPQNKPTTPYRDMTITIDHILILQMI